MSVLVFGANGQVGQILAKVDGIMATTRATADLRRPADCAELIKSIRPNAVLNVAGLWNPFLAEEQENLAYSVNAASPTAMAEACTQDGIPFVHLSSPAVFDGLLPMPYIAGDGPNPTTALGRTQLAGEQGVRSCGGVFVILRTSWVFDRYVGRVAAKFGALPQANRIQLPSDVLAAPTPAQDVAKALLSIAGTLANDPGKSGTYHLSGRDDVSMPEFFKAMCVSNHTEFQIEKLPIDYHPFGHLWQPNARLDCRSTLATFGIERPDWRLALRTMVPSHQYMDRQVARA